MAVPDSRVRRSPQGSPSEPARPVATARRIGRRALLGGAAAGLLAATGCGGPASAPLDLAPVATPSGPIPGFDDPRRWADRPVVVAAWGGEVQDALRKVVFEPFARATGAIVEEAATDYARIATPGPSGQVYADLLLVDALWAESGDARRRLRPIAPSVADPAVLARFGGGDRGIPAFAYAMVAAYRTDAVTEDRPLDGWAAWWDTVRFPGARSLGRNPFGTLEFALLAEGVEPASLYPLDLDRALRAIARIAGEIGDRWWSAGFEPVSWLGNGRADFASAWHYRVVAGQWDGLAVDWIWDQGLLVADRWVIPEAAAAPEIAEDLIRYALHPRVQAALAAEVPLGPVDPAAFDLIDPFLAAILPTAPAQIDRLIPADANWWAANRAEAERRLAQVLPGDPEGG